MRGREERERKKRGEPRERERCRFVCSRARVCTVCEPKEERRNNGLAKNGLKRTERRETKEKKTGEGGREGWWRCK